ncbi:Mur ligase family protein [Humibacillus xanthopallidus]|uniref:UDP-N-acetylmuramyl tripeptide synthase n=1 Tax=Humibacillus xanthopallidus TaxID=412689 RepID=A0A543HXK2_9MICO|nr:Mur ligase family protein [Humibacillus xanthopallidus]TQM62965.1 UDP-N-acetylmuramyl tripeptide synthase [Humibacillus xanthopallidus]
MTHARDPLRARAALATGKAAGRLSQALGRGSGSMIGGRLALRVDPEVLRAVAGDRRTVVVTGTNGKSTVTALVAAALSPGGAVVSNSTGANMTDGIVTAMAADRESGLAAIECDEVYLGPVARGTRPKAVVVLNSSREYTRGVSLKSTLEHWRHTAATLPDDCVAIVNVDDPLVSWAFETAPRRIGVSGGLYWRDDALVCPACGTVQDFTDTSWSCPGCHRSRPEPDWTVVQDGDGWAVEHAGGRTRLHVTVPGRTGPVGGAFALAAADALGVDVDAAAERISAVADVDGRYAPYRVGEHQARLLMLKNPAGWAEAIDVAVSTGRPLVVALDPFGPKDTATMWEAPFHRLAGREVYVTGGRRADGLAILDAAGVTVREAPDLESAVTGHAPGEVVVACNYPAFRRISKQFRGSTH